MKRLEQTVPTDEMGNTHRILIGKPEGKRSLW